MSLETLNRASLPPVEGSMSVTATDPEDTVAAFLLRPNCWQRVACPNCSSVVASTSRRRSPWWAAARRWTHWAAVANATR